MSRLSNKQNVRFGGLIAVLGGREPYSTILNDLVNNGLVEKSGDSWVLTQKGVNEKDRLSILAGLMVEADYVTHRPKNMDCISKANES